MSYQLNRKYRLLVGDYRNNNGLEITENQITFDINKSSDNSQRQNSASIQIYNLSKDSLAQLETDYVAAALYLGYEFVGEPKLVFSGQVVDCSTRKQGEDRVTQIIMGSGYVELNHQNISKVLSEGRTVKDVFEEIRKTIPNVSKGVYNGINPNSKLIHGYTLSAKVKDELDTLADTYDVEWRIDNDTLYVNDKDRAESENFTDAFVISPSTGLIEIPYYSSGDKRRDTKDVAKKQGVQLSMLINPDVYAGSIIKIEDTAINGWFKVDSVRYSGSYRDGSWLQEVYCSAIEKVVKKVE